MSRWPRRAANPARPRKEQSGAQRQRRPGRQRNRALPRQHQNAFREGQAGRAGALDGSRPHLLGLLGAKPAVDEAIVDLADRQHAAGRALQQVAAGRRLRVREAAMQVHSRLGGNAERVSDPLLQAPDPVDLATEEHPRRRIGQTMMDEMLEPIAQIGLQRPEQLVSARSVAVIGIGAPAHPASAWKQMRRCSPSAASRGETEVAFATAATQSLLPNSS